MTPANGGGPVLKTPTRPSRETYRDPKKTVQRGNDSGEQVEQLDLLDLALSETDWLSTATTAVKARAMTGRPFEIADAREDAGEPPSPSCWGALTNRLRREGVIECVGYAPSTAASRRSSLVRLWRGTPRWLEDPVR